MGLRGLAGDMARNTSGLWRGIAEAVDPKDRQGGGAPRSDVTDPVGAATAVPTVPAGPAAGTAEGFEEHGGRMIVPLDTWTRILEQIGHVHEAGQQLADARERAARAETENRFLREQLTDLKAQRKPVRGSTPKPAGLAAPTPSTSAPVEKAPEATRLVRTRRWMSHRISP